MACDNEMQRYLIFPDKETSTVKEILSTFGATKVIVRVHTSSSEIDFRVPSSIDFKELKEKLCGRGALTPVQEDFSGKSIQELLEMGDSLIIEERFWEAHNVLEDIWKNSSGNSKQIVHDVIGIIVSQIKVQMNQEGTGMEVYHRNWSSLRKKGIDAITVQLPEKFTYPIRMKLSELSAYLQ